MLSARLSVLLVFLALDSYSQTISLGVVGGTGLTRGFNTSSSHFDGIGPNGEPYSTDFTSTSNKGWILGPKIRIGLSGRLSVGIEAVHRELQWTDTTVFTPPVDVGYGTILSRFAFTRTSGSWEFPILLRYRAGGGRIHPFFEAGPSLRPAGTGTGLSHYGMTAGGGVEWQVGGFRISPGIRYTRWARLGHWQGVRLNQAEFVVGVDHFAGDSSGARVFGRKVSAGAVLGFAAGDDLQRAQENGYLTEPESNGLIAGLMLETNLWKNLFVEADGLYRPRHAIDRSPFSSDRVRYAVLTWEFPVLAKYKLTYRSVRPFLEAGPSFRASGNLNGAKPAHYGLTAGAGVEAHAFRLAIAPTIRYTRWAADDLPGGVLSPRTRPDQVSVLFSVSF